MLDLVFDLSGRMLAGPSGASLCPASGWISKSSSCFVAAPRQRLIRDLTALHQEGGEDMVKTAAQDSSILTEHVPGDPQFSTLREQKLFKRYLTVFNRRVLFPATEDRKAAAHDFDVVGHPHQRFHFTTCLPFHPSPDGIRPAEVSIVYEYSQGTNQMMYAVAAGGFDPSKHADFKACCRAELGEETLLEGGELVELLPPDHPGIAEVKWCANRFTPFLCIDPVPAATPGARDAEEEYMDVHRVTIPELKKIMHSGEMFLPSVMTCYMALDELSRRKLL